MQETLLDRVKNVVRRTSDRFAGRRIPAQRGGALENIEDRPLAAPAVDVYENETEFLVVADVPGAEPGNATVHLDERGQLALHVRLEIPEERWGRPPADWFRSFRLPDDVDRDRVDSSVKHGVMTVRLPKRRSTASVTIPVRG